MALLLTLLYFVSTIWIFSYILSFLGLPDSLLATYHNGSTPEEIAIQYPVLSLEDIYSAIAYYLSHRQEIDNYLEQRNQKAQQLRQQLTQKHNLEELRQRLLTRQSQKEAGQNAPSK
jgi:5-bromo-4-chloroindolyl phosphate hydrolysis protein